MVLSVPARDLPATLSGYGGTVSHRRGAYGDGRSFLATLADEIRQIGQAGDDVIADVMMDLSNAAQDFRIARDRFAERGEVTLSNAAEARRAEVIRVYDALADVFYRSWDEFLVSSFAGGSPVTRSGLGAVPVIAIIAGIIGGVALLAWITLQVTEAAETAALAWAAASICESNPGSPECRQAVENAKRKPDKGLFDFSGLFGFAKLGGFVFIGLKVAEIASKRRR